MLKCSFWANYAFSGERQSWEWVERLTRTKAKLSRRADTTPGQGPAIDLTYPRCDEWWGSSRVNDTGRAGLSEAPPLMAAA